MPATTAKSLRALSPKRQDLYDNLPPDALRWAVKRLAQGDSAEQAAQSTAVFAGRDRVDPQAVARLNFDLFPCFDLELQTLWDRTRARSELQQAQKALSDAHCAQVVRRVMDKAEREDDADLMLKAVKAAETFRHRAATNRAAEHQWVQDFLRQSDS